MEKALVSLGRKDLKSLIDEDQGAELVCHFCLNRYRFTTDELREMLKKAEEKSRIFLILCIALGIIAALAIAFIVYLIRQYSGTIEVSNIIEVQE